ncbi:unnamed protein product [Amoebophrya sp. A25]|nr:unnamed protein product [Amoebophrya sp. A25]|eukprot:GSA25T00010700001.1
MEKLPPAMREKLGPLYEWGSSTASTMDKKVKERPVEAAAAACAVGGVLAGYLIGRVLTRRDGTTTGGTAGVVSVKKNLAGDQQGGKKMPKLTRIYFLRHGESTNNVRSDEALREPDPGLTSLGTQQAANIGNYLSKLASYYNFKQVFISPMKKTLATATPLTTNLKSTPSTMGIHCEVHPLIYEYGGLFDEKYGTSKGMSRTDMKTMAPDVTVPQEDESRLSQQFKFPEDGDSGWYERESKETNEAYVERVKDVAEWLWTLEEASLLVTHGKFLDTLLKILLGVPCPLEGKEQSTPCIFLHGGCAFSCVELDHETGKVGVMYLNQPIVSESRLRTGHKIAGFSLKQW